ncbi:hypothetical protein [Mameliella alba]|uniref:hypothetical protein n=1 Tax=Mameliella alba TaxID=561184 RepID=UPI000B52F9D3|nr:hypothetical protein [Mameliella alba]OWV44204.1 hypothetical protein CDZ95_05830 [Mameliella alba]
MQKGGWTLPPIPFEVEHIHEVYLDLGPCQEGMSLSKHPHSEIALAAPWMDHRQRKLIRDMSAAYLEGRKIGEDPFGIPPAG